jgi:hypothetical protein
VKTARNVAIILALAAVVDLVPGGGAAADTIMVAISMAFFAAIAWSLFRLYNSQELTLMSMPDGRRAILYGSVGAIALLVAGYETFADMGGGILLWIGLMAGAVALIFVVWRDATQYS